MTSTADSQSAIPATDSEFLVPALVQRAQAGDRPAYDQLVDLFWKDIYRMLYFRTLSSPDAEDLAQEAFIKGYRGLGRLQDARLFKPWLYSIALNLVRDFQRKRKLLAVFSLAQEDQEQMVEQSGDPREGTALSTLMQKEFWDRVQAFCQELPRREREVFLLRFLDQLSIKEIAAALNQGESAVKTHLQRAVAKFRRKPSLLAFLRGEA